MFDNTNRVCSNIEIKNKRYHRSFSSEKKSESRDIYIQLINLSKRINLMFSY